MTQFEKRYNKSAKNLLLWLQMGFFLKVKIVFGMKFDNTHHINFTIRYKHWKNSTFATKINFLLSSYCTYVLSDSPNIHTEYMHKIYKSTCSVVYLEIFQKVGQVINFSNQILYWKIARSGENLFQYKRDRFVDLVKNNFRYILLR